MHMIRLLLVLIITRMINDRNCAVYLTMYVDEGYRMPQLTSYLNMTGLEIVFIVNIHKQSYTWILETCYLHNNSSFISTVKKQ